MISALTRTSDFASKMSLISLSDSWAAESGGGADLFCDCPRDAPGGREGGTGLFLSADGPEGGFVTWGVDRKTEPGWDAGLKRGLFPA